MTSSVIVRKIENACIKKSGLGFYNHDWLTYYLRNRMSLTVYPYIRDSEGKIIDLWPGETGAGRTLAGFEALRKEFYGSDAVAQLGCRLLSSLKDGDINAESDDLIVLRQEVETVLSKLREILPRLDLKRSEQGRVISVTGASRPEWEEYLSERLQNILEAIKTAQQHPNGRGGVGIS